MFQKQLSFQSTQEAEQSDEQLKPDDGEFMDHDGRFCVGSRESGGVARQGRSAPD